jgi:ubiquitin carboxyl-terminal hydrolase 5/13
MGFDVNGCKRAAFHTKNAGIEAALNWVMEHSADSDFDHPFVQPG